MTFPGFIAIEGPIGVGKTTLAGRLAHSFGYETLLEDADANPFLARFYEQPRENALSTQLFFLFQRAQQLQQLSQARAACSQAELFQSGHVSDYILQKDPIFAEINLDRDEFDLYRQVFGSLTIDVPKPDLVIYLQAPSEVLLKRIARRGNQHEKKISAAYLESLIDAYAEFFLHYQDTPLLIVNAAEINLATSEQDYESLVEKIRTCTGGRHYFNPLPAAEAAS